MADKFAVYSTDDVLVSLSQGLRLGKSLSVPEWIEGMLAGGTFTIPDSGSADAADSVVVYMVECASGTASRTIVLPANPRDGQVLVIKDANAGRSNVVIQGAGGSDTIDGATSYTLLYDNQAVVLRAQTYGGQVAWSILAEYKPQTFLTQMQWGGSYQASAFPAAPDSVFLPVGWVSQGTPSINLQYGMISVDASGFVQEFLIRLIGNALDAGDSFTFNLRKNGTTQMSLGPYSGATATVLYTTTTGAFSVVKGDLLTVEMAYTTLAGTGTIAVIGACAVAF